MNILTNWIFWIIIAALVFVIALIGYLSESIKKNKKAEENNDSVNDANVENNAVLTSETQSVDNTSSIVSDFNVMPEINSNSVSQPSDVISNSSLDSDVFDVPSTLETPATSVEQTPVVETPVASVEQTPVVETPVASVEQTPVVETPVASVEQTPVVKTPVASVEQTPVVETPVAPIEQSSVVETPATIEPDSVFTANIDKPISNTPTPVPAEPAPVIEPTQIPADVNSEVKMENQTVSSRDDIETL